MPRWGRIRPVRLTEPGCLGQETAPPCPDCGHSPTLPHETDAPGPEASRQAPPLVVFLSAFLLLGLYALLILSTYLLYPTLLMILAAASALWARWFQPTRKKEPPLKRLWHCPHCGLDFVAPLPGGPADRNHNTTC